MTALFVPGEKRPPTSRWKSSRVDVQIVGATLVLKALLLVFGVAVVMLLGGKFAPDTAGGTSSDSRALVEPWSRWDALHYTDLAVFGYRAVEAGDLIGPGGYRSIAPGNLPSDIVFYPLFPWLVGALDALVHDPAVAALAVSGFASLFVGPLLYRLVSIEEGATVAGRSVVFLLLFPTAYFLHIGYTESLFLAVVLGSFLAARTDRWWLAGVLGAFATLTRVNGLVLIPALAVEALIQWWPDRKWRWGWLAIGLIPLGFAGYLGLNLAVYGDAAAFLRFEAEFWKKSLSLPWVGIGGLLKTTKPGAWIPELAFVALGLIGTIVAALRFRPSWTVWMAGNWLLFTSTSVVMSVPRYSLGLFPLFVWFALLARSVRATFLIAALSTLGFVYLAGRFALGLWAF